MNAEKTNLYKKISGIMRVPFSPQHSKKTMADEKFAELLTGEVEIEEKLDGGTYLLEIPEEPDIYIFGEFLKYKHTVPYNKVPMPADSRFLWYVVFDIYNKKDEKFINRKQREEYAEVCGFCLSPQIYKRQISSNIDATAKFIKKLAKQKSNLGDGLMEGVVIKNYEKQLFGKYINEEFRIEVHWRNKPIELNRLMKNEH